MSGVIQESALKAVMQYEHRKAGKLVSKGYSFGDWQGFGHLVQEYGRFHLEEAIFSPDGQLFKKVCYRGMKVLLAKIGFFFIKARF